MDNVAIKQDELDSLFGLEELDLDNKKHIWLIKNKTNHSIIGGRNFSFMAAQAVLQKATKEYPNCQLEIIQVK